MLGRQKRWQEDLFVAGPLGDLIPDDHILKRVDKVLDLSWLRDEVHDCYDENMGRPGIDPEAAVRLMLAGLFEGIVHDRKLMRQAQVNIAMRWFAGYRLDEKLPDHSSLTRIRQRFGEERFRKIFQRSVQACSKAGLIDGETVHVDATLIRADVSWQSLTERHIDAVLRENPDFIGTTTPTSRVDGGEDDPPSPQLGRPCKRPKKPKKYSATDPDASMTTSCKQYRMEPCYKQHTAVDDRAGVIVDVAVTTGEASEGKYLPQQIDRIQANTSKRITTITADRGYAHSHNYGMLEERRIHAVIPPPKVRTSRQCIAARHFKYDHKHKIVRCPKGRKLRATGRCDTAARVYRSKAGDCGHCVLRERCFPITAKIRVIRIADRQDALIRARRRHAQGNPLDRRLYNRHRWRVEGIHGEAKTQHGLRRAVRRGLANVAIQAYLTAVVMNLKRLAMSGWAYLLRLSRAFVMKFTITVQTLARIYQINPIHRTIT